MTTVTDHLEHLGIRFRVVPHARTTSALGEALALGISADEVAKAVVLDVDDGHILAIVPASRMVDLDLVREILGQDDVHVAAESEVAQDFPEYELGALPPLPSLLHVPVVIDPSVLAHRRVTFSAGTQSTSVSTDTDEVFTGASVTIAPISRPYGSPRTSLAPR
jgi:Ala-tRNA(Pro) deacylase